MQETSNIKEKVSTSEKHFNIKDHPLGIAGTCIGATIILCVTIGVPLHNAIIEGKDGIIQQKDATNELLKEENESLRRRLQGDVVLVSTDDIEMVQSQIGDLETKFVDEFVAISKTLSELRDIKTAVDRSLTTTTPQDYAELRRVANIRPDGKNVHWIGGDRRSGTGISSVTSSSISQKLHLAFEEFNNNKTEMSKTMFQEIATMIPAWPYSYFYLGLNSIKANKPDLSHFKEAAIRFERLRQAGILEPELLLYEAMTRTFLEDYEATQELLSSLSEFNDNVEEVTIIAINNSTPEHIHSRFVSIAKKKEKKITRMKISKG